MFWDDQTQKFNIVQQWLKQTTNVVFSFESLPPLYTWPRPLKQAILWLIIALCISSYLVLIGAVLLIGIELLLRYA